MRLFAAAVIALLSAACSTSHAALRLRDPRDVMLSTEGQDAPWHPVLHGAVPHSSDPAKAAIGTSSLAPGHTAFMRTQDVDGNPHTVVVTERADGEIDLWPKGVLVDAYGRVSVEVDERRAMVDDDTVRWDVRITESRGRGFVDAGIIHVSTPRANVFSAEYRRSPDRGEGICFLLASAILTGGALAFAVDPYNNDRRLRAGMATALGGLGVGTLIIGVWGLVRRDHAPIPGLRGP